MNRVFRVAFVVLIGALVASIGLNVYLYQKGRDYYLQLNAIRLDPLDIDAFPDDGLTPVQQKSHPTIVFFGDSRAAEWPTPTELKDVSFINRGIGAQTSTQVVWRFAEHIAPLQPDKIILQVGINDLKTIPLFPEQKDVIVRNCKANIQTIVELSLEVGAKEVILTTIFPLGQIPLERRPLWSEDVASAIEEVNLFIRSLADDRVTVLDTGQILAGGDGIILPQYSRDFLHLNSAGYTVLNQALVQVLRK